MPPQSPAMDRLEPPVRHQVGQCRPRQASHVKTIRHRRHCRSEAVDNHSLTPAVMDHFEQSLSRITLAPYIVKAMALIGVKRKGGSNMFRHQISTMGILLDYKMVDPVLLKAACIHDLFEDAASLPGVSKDEITSIDEDGPAVYDLVMEVTMRTIDGMRESKAEYLTRLMLHGSPQ